MPSPLNSRLARDLRSDGWDLEITGGGHIKATHPEASAPMYMSASPSDQRAEQNARAIARRLLRRNS